jgi:hypothetical protein
MSIIGQADDDRLLHLEQVVEDREDEPEQRLAALLRPGAQIRRHSARVDRVEPQPGERVAVNP